LIHYLIKDDALREIPSQCLKKIFGVVFKAVNKLNWSGLLCRGSVMQTVNLFQAKTHLSKLIDQIASGEGGVV
jgi:hypothetical protein